MTEERLKARIFEPSFPQTIIRDGRWALIRLGGVYKQLWLYHYCKDTDRNYITPSPPLKAGKCPLCGEEFSEKIRVTWELMKL